ncbi:MAG: hypothetical protein GY820_26785 [Gammaproteobacteria bacterium]|nr:hypothetical protein [Gammaproteobacteria bacterium]
MDAHQLNKILFGVPLFVPISPEGDQRLPDCHSTIYLTGGNHWVGVVKEEGRRHTFDSKPFQSTNSCGLFCCAVILAHSFGGLAAVNRLWFQFQEEDGRNEELVIDLLEEWRGGR